LLVVEIMVVSSSASAVVEVIGNSVVSISEVFSFISVVEKEVSFSVVDKVMGSAGVNVVDSKLFFKVFAVSVVSEILVTDSVIVEFSSIVSEVDVSNVEISSEFNVVFEMLSSSDSEIIFLVKDIILESVEVNIFDFKVVDLELPSEVSRDSVGSELSFSNFVKVVFLNEVSGVVVEDVEDFKVSTFSDSSEVNVVVELSASSDDSAIKLLVEETAISSIRVVAVILSFNTVEINVEGNTVLCSNVDKTSILWVVSEVSLVENRFCVTFDAALVTEVGESVSVVGRRVVASDAVVKVFSDVADKSIVELIGDKVENVLDSASTFVGINSVVASIVVSVVLGTTVFDAVVSKAWTVEASVEVITFSIIVEIVVVTISLSSALIWFSSIDGATSSCFLFFFKGVWSSIEFGTSKTFSSVISSSSVLMFCKSFGICFRVIEGWVNGGVVVAISVVASVSPIVLNVERGVAFVEWMIGIVEIDEERVNSVVVVVDCECIASEVVGKEEVEGTEEVVFTVSGKAVMGTVVCGTEFVVVDCVVWGILVVVVTVVVVAGVVEVTTSEVNVDKVGVVVDWMVVKGVVEVTAFSVVDSEVVDGDVDVNGEVVVGIDAVTVVVAIGTAESVWVAGVVVVDCVFGGTNSVVVILGK
jgi:hypothetical protein